jgi:hypothetical protein
MREGERLKNSGQLGRDGSREGGKKRKEAEEE